MVGQTAEKHERLVHEEDGVRWTIQVSPAQARMHNAQHAAAQQTLRVVKANVCLHMHTSEKNKLLIKYRVQHPLHAEYPPPPQSQRVTSGGAAALVKVLASILQSNS